MIENAARSLILYIALSASCLASGGLDIRHAWVRAAPPGARFVAAYVEIVNHSKIERRLLSASSPDAASVELHRSEVIDGLMRMEAVGAVTIPAGATFSMQPGGYHFMISAPGNDIQAGGRVSLSLEFDHGESRSVEALVMPVTFSGARE